MTTYSSLATTMWPPPSSDTTSRLQRLQELENMRKERQLKSTSTSTNEPSTATTRLSRRQQISGSIGLHRLSANHDEKRKSFQGRRALAERSTPSVTSEHGGARPKNFDLSSRRTNEEGRERISSISSNEDSSAPLSRHVTGSFQSVHSEQSGNEYDRETFSAVNKTEFHPNTSVSEDEEDIESFKRSLYGKHSLVNVPERKILQLSRINHPNTTIHREIDTSRLLIHREEPKVENKYSSSFSSQRRFDNIVSDSMKRLDNLFDQPTPKIDSLALRSRNSGYESRSRSARLAESVNKQTNQSTVRADSVHESQDNQECQSVSINVGTDSGQLMEANQPNISNNKIDNRNENNIESESVVNPSSDKKGGNSVVSDYPNLQTINAENLTSDCQETSHVKSAGRLDTGTEQPVQKPTMKQEEELSKGDTHEEQTIIDTMTVPMNEYPVLVKKEDEEDLVDASNVAFFEMSSNDTNQYIPNESYGMENTDFSATFTNRHDFLNYDNANRVESDISDETGYGVSSNYNNGFRSRLRTPSYTRQSSDTVSSMLYGDSEERSSSRYRTMPYSSREPSQYTSYTSSLDTRKSSAGSINISKDAFSRIDDLFDQPKAENPLLSNIQSKTLPRKRARDSLVGSRPTITRSRSDASDSGYETRSLLGRSLRNYQANDQEEVADRQPLFRSSLDQNKPEESVSSVTTRFGSLRSRLGIGSGGHKDTSESTEPTNTRYIRSISSDYYDSGGSDYGNNSSHSNEHDVETDSLRYKPYTSRSHDFQSGHMSGLGDMDISAKISQLRSEISSEFFGRKESENDDLSRTLTHGSETIMPDGDSNTVTQVVDSERVTLVGDGDQVTMVTNDDSVSPVGDSDTVTPIGEQHEFLTFNTEEPLPVQSELEMSETVYDEEIKFSSSCKVEIGEMLVLPNQIADNETSAATEVSEKEVMNENPSDTNVNKKTSQATEVSEDKVMKQNQKEANVDQNKTESSHNKEASEDVSKVSSDNESKSTTSSNSSSSKKKKNKKRGKRANTPDSSKHIVSHPSEVLKKNKRAQSKENLNKSVTDLTPSKASKDGKSPKKSKDKSDNKAKGEVKEGASSGGSVTSDSSKGKSKVKNLFDTLLHALDRKSDTTSSVNLSECNSSQKSGEITPVHDKGQNSDAKTPVQNSGEITPVQDDWEIIPDPISSEPKLIHEDNYATFENEDIIQCTKRKSSDDNGGVSTDYYETASDHTISGASEYEEFYEAYPTELLGDFWSENNIQSETERKEHFVYVCASSKVKRTRIPSEDSQNMDHISKWIDNNLYPGKKYPEMSEKVANKKFTESSDLHNNDLPLPANDLKTESSLQKDIDETTSAAGTDHKIDTRGLQDSGIGLEKEVNENVPEVETAPKIDIVNRSDSELEVETTPKMDIVNKNDSELEVETAPKMDIVNKSDSEVVSADVTEIKTVSTTKQEETHQNGADVVGQEHVCGHSETSTEPQKMIENTDLNLSASDKAFTDRLVSALQQRLCAACQPILVDILRETYFNRYEEIAKVDLKNSSTSLESLEKDTKPDKCSPKTNGNDNKKAQRPKRLEVDDLLYGNSKVTKNGKVSNGSQDSTKTRNNVPSSSQMLGKDKPIMATKNDNFVGSPNGKVSPPKSSEVKIKGKIVNIDKSKKERVVSPKPEQRLCRRKSSDAQKESCKSDNEEEYKLPHLRDNPFIRSDKMRVSTKGKSDLNGKNSEARSPHLKRSMTFQSGDKHKSPSRQKSLERQGSTKDSKSSTRQKSTERRSSLRDSTSSSRQKSVERPSSVNNSKSQSREKSLERQGSVRNSKSPSRQKSTDSAKSVKDLKNPSQNSVNGQAALIGSNNSVEAKNSNGDTDFKNNPTKSVTNGKKTPPMSPKRPNLLEQLSLAKTACENIGIGSDIDKNSDHDSEPKTIVAPPRKKKFSSPFRDTDVTNDLDLSPDGGNGVEGEEVAPHRINLINWDPTKLLKVLYTVKLNKDTTEDVSHQFVNMEGLMEKLPMNKKKATLLKTWKRRFFRAKDGWLHYYEGLSEDQQTPNRDKPSDSVQLMGGKIEDLGNRVLGVDDGRGRFLMVRCPTEKEYGQWKLALESQTVNNIKATYVRPALSSPPHPEKPVVIIDIGSGGIRAGIMGAQPCLPQMFFPSIVARNKNTKELVIGIDAFKPDVRKNSTLIKVVEPSNKVDKFAIDMELIAAVFDYIFKGLQLEPAKYWVMLSTPYKLGDTAMTNLMKILVNTYRTKGVCMVMQSLLSLYSYNATSGIIVDIGERMEILPIFDGVLIEGGVSRQAYGGQKITDSLNSSLVGLKYKFYNPVDKLLVRYVMEQSCYVCDNYKDLKSKCDKDSESFQTTVYLNNFDLPDDAHMSVTHDLSCFESPEGFFNTDLWGMDYPVVHKLIYSAIQSCPMDNRKHMYRAIYLSGGVTMLAGFAERLEGELKKLAPPGVVVEVHASPQRYHSAFIGAGTLLSNVPINEQIFISAEEWTRDGAKAFRKWKGPS